MAKQTRNADAASDWGKSSPLSDDPYSSYGPLWLPDAYEGDWPMRYQVWSRLFSRCLHDLHAVASDIGATTSAVRKHVDEVMAYSRGLHQRVVSFIISTDFLPIRTGIVAFDAGPSAAAVARIELAASKPLKGRRLASAWTAIRADLLTSFEKVNRSLRPIRVVPALAASLAELDRLLLRNEALETIPTIVVLHEVKKKCVVVRVGDRDLTARPSAAWLLATCGMPGFENEEYGTRGIRDFSIAMEKAGFHGLGRYLHELDEKPKSRKHYSRFEMAPELRARISLDPQSDRQTLVRFLELLKDGKPVPKPVPKKK